MKLIQRVKTLWALSSTNDAVGRLEHRVVELMERTENMATLLSDLLKTQTDIQTVAETARKEAEASVQEARNGALELHEALTQAESTAAAKIRKLEEQSVALASDVRRQVDACRAEADKLAPEIRRLADAVQELNG